MTKYANLNAVTLVRVSTKKQGGEDKFGMNAQRTSNARIVAAQGFVVRKTVEYSDVSGDAVMYTPEMEELQAYLRTPEMKGGNLVAKELSRLLRPDYDSYPLLTVFVNQRITIHTPQYELQLWTHEGRLLAGILCAVDFNEAERIRDRCMGGREAARELGYCASGGQTTPTGTLWHNSSKTWSYDPLYAPTMAEIYRMVGDGETNLTRIIRKFQFKLRGSSNLATPTALRRLLQNRIFIGERVWDKKLDLSIPKEQLMYRGEDGKWHKRNRPLIPREPHEVIVKQVITPGLVTVELFDRVQTILRALTDRVHQAHALSAALPKFVYRGLLFCADCGDPLYTATNSSRYRYYRCRSRCKQRGGTGECKAPNMSQARLEAELDRVFSMEFTFTKLISAAITKQMGADSRKSSARRRVQLEARQQALAVKRERILAREFEGKITKAESDRWLKPVDEELAANRRLLEELVEIAPPTSAQLGELLRPLRAFPRLSIDEKRRLITSRFQQIKVRDYRVTSLYLLTGDIVTPDLSKFPPLECLSCRDREKELGHDRYCAYCAYEIEGTTATERALARRRKGRRPEVHPGVLTSESSRQSAVGNSSQRL